MVEIKVARYPTRQCARPIYNYKVEFIPEDFTSWLAQFGTIKITQFDKKFFIFKHHHGFQVSSVIGGQTLKIYGTNDKDSFNEFETQMINYFSTYDIPED